MPTDHECKGLHFVTPLAKVSGASYKFKSATRELHSTYQETRRIFRQDVWHATLANPGPSPSNPHKQRAYLVYPSFSCPRATLLSVRIVCTAVDRCIQIWKPMWPFFFAAGVTLYGVTKMQEAALKSEIIYSLLPC